MKKHSNVPASATWNEQDYRWELGKKNEQEKKIGIWNYWHAEGNLFRTVDYNDGNSPYFAKRFNRDGSLEWERLYNQHTGGVIEHHEYRGDKLQTSVVYGAGESMQIRGCLSRSGYCCPNVAFLYKCACYTATADPISK